MKKQRMKSSDVFRNLNKWETIQDLWCHGSLPTTVGMMFLWNKSYKVHSTVALAIKWVCFGTPQMPDDISPLIHGLTYFNCPIPFLYDYFLYDYSYMSHICLCQAMYFGDAHEMSWNRSHFIEDTLSLLQPPRSKSRRWRLKSQCQDQTNSTSIRATSQSLSVCCCFLTQLSCLCLPAQVLHHCPYVVKNVSVRGHIYLATYFLALGFCFVSFCRHYQARGQCLYWVGVTGRHKQNQPSCALKNQARIIYIFHVRKMKCVLAVDGKLERSEGEWRSGRIAPLFLGPLPDNHSTFYSWSQLLPSLLRPSKCYNFLAVIPSMLSGPRMAWKGRALWQKGVYSRN